MCTYHYTEDDVLYSPYILVWLDWTCTKKFIWHYYNCCSCCASRAVIVKAHGTTFSVSNSLRFGVYRCAGNKWFKIHRNNVIRTFLPAHIICWVIPHDNYITQCTYTAITRENSDDQNHIIIWYIIVYLPIINNITTSIATIYYVYTIILYLTVIFLFVLQMTMASSEV
jgi:hypothetical protein